MFLLLLPLEVQSQDGRVKDLGKLRPLLNLFGTRNFPVLMIQGCRDFGFEEFLLLLCHTVGASPAFLPSQTRLSVLVFKKTHVSD